jgi:hypothetical protein
MRVANYWGYIRIVDPGPAARENWLTAFGSLSGDLEDARMSDETQAIQTILQNHVLWCGQTRGVFERMVTAIGDSIQAGTEPLLPRFGAPLDHPDIRYFTWLGHDLFIKHTYAPGEEKALYPARIAYGLVVDHGHAKDLVPLFQIPIDQSGNMPVGGAVGVAVHKAVLVKLAHSFKPAEVEAWSG